MNRFGVVLLLLIFWIINSCTFHDINAHSSEHAKNQHRSIQEVSALDSKSIHSAPEVEQIEKEEPILNRKITNEQIGNNRNIGVTQFEIDSILNEIQTPLPFIDPPMENISLFDDFDPEGK